MKRKLNYLPVFSLTQDENGMYCVENENNNYNFIGKRILVKDNNNYYFAIVTLKGQQNIITGNYYYYFASFGDLFYKKIKEKLESKEDLIGEINIDNKLNSIPPSTYSLKDNSGTEKFLTWKTPENNGEISKYEKYFSNYSNLANFIESNYSLLADIKVDNFENEKFNFISSMTEKDNSDNIEINENLNLDETEIINSVTNPTNPKTLTARKTEKDIENDKDFNSKNYKNKLTGSEENYELFNDNEDLEYKYINTDKYIDRAAPIISAHSYKKHCLLEQNISPIYYIVLESSLFSINEDNNENTIEIEESYDSNDSLTGINEKFLNDNTKFYYIYNGIKLEGKLTLLPAKNSDGYYYSYFAALPEYLLAQPEIIKNLDGIEIESNYEFTIYWRNENINDNKINGTDKFKIYNSDSSIYLNTFNFNN